MEMNCLLPLKFVKLSGMSLIKIVAPLEPVPFPRPASNVKRRFNPKRYVEFKDALGTYARLAMKGAEPFTGEVKLHADFFRPKPRPRKGQNPQVSFIGDIDNYLKAVMDALIGICYVDDRQVANLSGRKIFGEPHILIELEGK